VVRECAPIPKKIHDQSKTLGMMEEVERYFPGFKAFVDSTEQEIPRWKDATKRKTHYSGKNRKNTVKTQLTVNGDDLIVHKAPHARGRRHYLSIYKGNHPSLPKEVEQDFDRGYDGVRNYFPGLKCALPFKKRAKERRHRGEKAEEPLLEQKSFNKELSKAGVVVEYTISSVKKFNVFGQEFRNRLRHYEAMTDIFCGLVNARIAGSE
jgi:hypothetical protein